MLKFHNIHDFQKFYFLYNILNHHNKYDLILKVYLILPSKLKLFFYSYQIISLNQILCIKAIFISYKKIL